jgi:lipopolysaccharide transport system permease protein
MSTATDTAPVVDQPPLRVLKPVKRRVRLRDVWTSREVARMIALRDIKTKYKQTALGPLWLLIAPLGMLVAITIAFSGVTQVDTHGVPYIPFALTGLVAWTYFQLSISLGAGSIVANHSLVRRSAIPRIALVTGMLLGNLPPVAVMLAATILSAAIAGVMPVQVLLLPILVAWLVFFVGSAALLVASISVRFRDIVAAIPLVLQAGLFVTPVGYPIQGAPAHVKVLLELNPLSGLIEAWRWSVLGMPIDWGVVAIGGLWTVGIAILGWQVFTRLEVHFSDVI